MTEQVSPFTKEQLIPQEEKLEVFKHKGELFIGIPKENAYQEKRICLSPDAVAAMTAHGHQGSDRIGCRGRRKIQRQRLFRGGRRDHSRHEKSIFLSHDP